MPGFDMHVHSTASDGTLDVDEIINLAIYTGLEGIALTDHDTIGGLERAEALGHKLGYPVIPGIELSTEHQDQEIHILGYLFDYRLPRVLEKLQELQDARVSRIIKMVDKLSQLGYHVDKEEVFELAGSGSVGRPHIAYVLLKKGYISSIQEAFQRLIGRGCSAYIPRFKLSPVEAIAFIREAGGIPVMAHPGLSSSDQLIPLLLEHGLMGIEVFHPDHKPEDEVRYLDMAAKYHLIVTGGSDFHGYKEGNRCSLGCKTVSPEILSQLKFRKQMEKNNENF
ncbi:PHP domain-containing protein [Candidatus Formimonas warabiya]|uniref:Polymerase/histidinol phosphatase N-terminal domain-containing protein n=1 Tax=Formimonas warabiya TaxID=1761012 RepID=A0A3G1KP43_FORW1|nr:PHP domain-containing protein [Candidatus Formimonas warabiya]ATW24234.1 hypothetical protein DCMF_05035 [Candidatus Formimonas warabiya]